MSALEQFGATTKKPGRGLGRRTLALRGAILAVLEKTAKPVTVRQVFYLLSTRGAVEKTEAGYRQAARQLLQLRRGRIIPYEWIADNTRWMRKPRSYSGLADCLAATAEFYRAAVWRDLPDYIEIWCEKDALAGVIFEETHRYDVPLMVSRGYCSESFAFEAAGGMPLEDKSCTVYYVGDLDPSGWDAARDLESRLYSFSGGQIHFYRLAVTPEQIETLSLPTRPSKRTDTRYPAFQRQFGHGAPSVELDAIPPDTLRQIVREAIESHLPDGHLWAVEREEEAARETLGEILEGLA